MQNRVHLISDTQLVVEFTNYVSPLQAKTIADSAQEKYRQGGALALSKDFDLIDDRPKLEPLEELTKRVEVLEKLIQECLPGMHGHSPTLELDKRQ